jgi:NAD(P)H-hydrate epimerase
MGARIVADGMPSATLPPAVVLDGLIGYSLKGAPFGRIAELIRWANALDAPVLALDTPSGLDATTGVAFDPAIRATATMTLAVPKHGLRAPDASALVGELYLADISVPPGLYGRPPLGFPVGAIFALDDILRIG